MATGKPCSYGQFIESEACRHCVENIAGNQIAGTDGSLCPQQYNPQKVELSGKKSICCQLEFTIIVSTHVACNACETAEMVLSENY